MRSSLAVLVFFLFCFAPSRAGVYLGGGVGVARTQYNTTGGSVSSQSLAPDLQSISGAINSSPFIFSGSQADLQNFINTTYFPNPTSGNTGNFFITINNGDFGSVCTLTQGGVTVIQDPNVYNPNNGCQHVSNPNLSATLLDLSTDSAAALSAVQTDIGRVLGDFYLSSLGGSMQASFANSAETYAFYNALGSAVLANVTGMQSYTLGDVQTAMLDPSNPASQLFNLSDTGSLNFGFYPGDSNFQSLYAEIIQPAFLQTAANLNILFVTGNLSGLSPAQIVDLALLKDSSSSVDFQIGILAGMGRFYGDTYLGFEVAVDIGGQKTGKNSDREIELSSKYTAMLMGRFGYITFKNFMNYVNAGLAFRSYDLNYSGQALSFKSSSGVKPHYLLGTGVEFFYSDKLGFFSELNYFVPTALIDSGSPDSRKLDVATAQLKFGFRYYMEGVAGSPGLKHPKIGR